MVQDKARFAMRDCDEGAEACARRCSSARPSRSGGCSAPDEARWSSCAPSRARAQRASGRASSGSMRSRCRCSRSSRWRWEAPEPRRLRRAAADQRQRGSLRRRQARFAARTCRPYAVGEATADAARERGLRHREHRRWRGRAAARLDRCRSAAAPPVRRRTASRSPTPRQHDHASAGLSRRRRCLRTGFDRIDGRGRARPFAARRRAAGRACGGGWRGPVGRSPSPRSAPRPASAAGPGWKAVEAADAPSDARCWPWRHGCATIRA